MLIVATADIHSPLYYDIFVRAINNLQKQPDLFLIAGDLIDRNITKDTGLLNELRKISNALFGKINCPIFACFGNNEFEQDWDEIKKQNQEIKFLQDESIVVNIGDKKVGIVGSKGSLDKPTWWQKNNIPNIAETYKERVGKINELLGEMKADYKILLIHYPPTHEILSGENPSGYGELACKDLEEVVINNKVDLVLTGHVHRGKKEVWLDETPVLNVGLNLNNGLVIVDTDKLKPGLERFF